MFRVVGAITMTVLAIYGLTKFFQEHVVSEKPE